MGEQAAEERSQLIPVEVESEPFSHTGTKKSSPSSEVEKEPISANIFLPEAVQEDASCISEDISNIGPVTEAFRPTNDEDAMEESKPKEEPTLLAKADGGAGNTDAKPNSPAMKNNDVDCNADGGGGSIRLELDSETADTRSVPSFPEKALNDGPTDAVDTCNGDAKPSSPMKEVNESATVPTLVSHQTSPTKKLVRGVSSEADALWRRRLSDRSPNRQASRSTATVLDKKDIFASGASQEVKEEMPQPSMSAEKQVDATEEKGSVHTEEMEAFEAYTKENASSGSLLEPPSSFPMAIASQSSTSSSNAPEEELVDMDGESESRDTKMADKPLAEANEASLGSSQSLVPTRRQPGSPEVDELDETVDEATIALMETLRSEVEGSVSDASGGTGIRRAPPVEDWKVPSQSNQLDVSLGREETYEQTYDEFEDDDFEEESAAGCQEECAERPDTHNDHMGTDLLSQIPLEVKSSPQAAAVSAGAAMDEDPLEDLFADLIGVPEEL